jgi:Holliday junction resolvasome RuvABC ATP-dependent DNA helicase subunit
LNRPLRERFGIEVELEPPCSETIMKILNDQETISQPKYFSEYHGQDKAKDILMLHIKALYRSVSEDIYGISKTAQKIIAERSCNTPRIAKQLYSNARAKALVEGHKEIQVGDVLYVLELLGIDENGVSNAGRRIINHLLDRGNVPIGADNLADVGRVSLADLKDMIEPRLIQLGLLERTKKGRLLTEKALRLYGQCGVKSYQQRVYMDSQK